MLRRRHLLISMCVLTIAVPASRPGAATREGGQDTPHSKARDNEDRKDRRHRDPCVRSRDENGARDEELDDDPTLKSQGVDEGSRRLKVSRVRERCEPIGGGSGVARGDFNGDGIGDLAVGVPDENVNGAIDAGAVNVIYGSSDGLTATGNQFFTQDSPGMPGVTENFDRFGLTLASGEFNGDSYSDLAIGVPHEDINGSLGEGFVHILHGSDTGLHPATSFELLQISPANVTCACHFGGALAWGDFNGDDVGDLAIGMPTYFVLSSGIFSPPRTDAGGVVVLYGRVGTGLSSVGHQVWIQGNQADPLRPVLSAGDTVEDGDQFGAALAAGDHNGDGFDDLAIGVPFEDLNFVSLFFAANEGMTHVLFGSGFGLSVNGRETYVQGEGFVSGVAENGDGFGQRLAMGDVDGDGSDELIVGVPFEDVGSRDDAGAVFVLNRRDQSSQVWHQDVISGVIAQSGDHFGYAVASADFNGDGREDVAIGVPDEDFGNIFTNPVTFRPNGGMVHVLYGSSNGVTTSNAQMWHQDVSGVPGAVEIGDQFGFSLSAWNFGKTSHRDLVIGVPGETTADTLKVGAGAVIAIYGSASRLTTTGSQLWSQATPGILDAADTDDRFGASLY